MTSTNPISEPEISALPVRAIRPTAQQAAIMPKEAKNTKRRMIIIAAFLMWFSLFISAVHEHGRTRQPAVSVLTSSS